MMKTFEVNGVTYELDGAVKEYFLSKLESENTVDAYFDEDGCLVHKYRKSDGTIAESTIDVVTVFETYPDEAERVLEKIGILEELDIHIEGDSLVSLDEMR